MGSSEYQYSGQQQAETLMRQQQFYDLLAKHSLLPPDWQDQEDTRWGKLEFCYCTLSSTEVDEQEETV